MERRLVLIFVVWGGQAKKTCLYKESEGLALPQSEGRVFPFQEVAGAKILGQ